MSPSRDHSREVTGAFSTESARAHGLSATIREALAEHGINPQSELERFMTRVPCRLTLRGRDNQQEAVLAFADGERRHIVRLTLMTLPSEQAAYIQALVQGQDPTQKVPPPPLQVPEALLSHSERITAAIAHCVQHVGAVSALKHQSSMEGFGPREYALLARGLLAERYAAAGHRQRAGALYDELLVIGDDRIKASTGEGATAERTIKAVGELYGYLLCGAVRGKDSDLIEASTSAILRALAEVKLPIYQAAFLSFCDDAFLEMLTMGRSAAVFEMVSKLTLPQQVQSLKELFMGFDERISEQTFHDTEDFAAGVIGELEAQTPDGLGDADDLRSDLHSAAQISALRLGYRTVDEVTIDGTIDRSDGGAAGVLAGAYIRGGQHAEARKVLSECISLNDEQDRELEARSFICTLLDTAPQGFDLAAEALSYVHRTDHRIIDSFRLVCAAFQARQPESGERAFSEWLKELPPHEPSDKGAFVSGTFNWAIAEALKHLRRQPADFEHHAAIFTQLFDAFVPHFSGENRNDLSLMQQFFTFAGEFGALESLSRLDRFHEFSPRRRFELMLSTIVSRAVEGHLDLANKAVSGAHAILLDAADQAARGVAPEFEPLMFSRDASEGYLRQKTRLLQAVLKANLSPASEEIADSLVGNALMAGKGLLPCLTYDVAFELRKWELRGKAQFRL